MDYERLWKLLREELFKKLEEKTESKYFLFLSMMLKLENEMLENIK
jgi:hypothetical protein